MAPRLYRCKKESCAWVGEKVWAIDHYARQHGNEDDVPFGCRACDHFCGSDLMLKRHLDKALHLKLMQLSGLTEETAIIRRGKGENLLKFFVTLSAEEVKETRNKRKLKRNKTIQSPEQNKEKETSSYQPKTEIISDRIKEVKQVKEVKEVERTLAKQPGNIKRKRKATEQNQRKKYKTPEFCESSPSSTSQSSSPSSSSTSSSSSSSSSVPSSPADILNDAIKLVGLSFGAEFNFDNEDPLCSSSIITSSSSTSITTSPYTTTLSTPITTSTHTINSTTSTQITTSTHTTNSTSPMLSTSPI